MAENFKSADPEILFYISSAGLAGLGTQGSAHIFILYRLLVKAALPAALLVRYMLVGLLNTKPQKQFDKYFQLLSYEVTRGH